MMIKRIMVTVACLGLAAGGLQAQQVSDATQRIQAAQTRVAQAGLPVELLLLKVAEGRAKGIPEERIAVAAERRAAGLIRAQEALASAGRQPAAGVVAAGADALEAGADASSLRQVVRQAREAEAAVALAVLATLVMQGLPLEQARERVESALAEGGAALASLPQRGTDARGRQGPPEHAGRPANAGRGNAVGNGHAGRAPGPPAAVPGAGSRPGKNAPKGPPGGKPPGAGGGRP